MPFFTVNCLGALSLRRFCFAALALALTCRLYRHFAALTVPSFASARPSLPLVLRAFLS